MVIWFDFDGIRLRALLRQTATADALDPVEPLRDVPAGTQVRVHAEG